MKLLASNDVRTAEDKKLSTNLLRSADLDKELARKRLELDKLEADFQLSIESQRLVWEEDKSILINQVNNLKLEVNQLEEKRKDLLVPLNEKWKEIELADKSLMERGIQLATQRNLVEEKLEALEEKLSDVADRELVVKELEQKLTLRQQGIEDQKAEIKKQGEVFNRVLLQANEDWKVKTRELDRRQAQDEADRKYFDTIKKDLLKREAYLINKERELQDRYATLERTEKRCQTPKETKIE